MDTITLVHRGHLIDSGLLTKILAVVIEEGADYEITSFVIGKTPDDESSMEFVLKAPNPGLLAETASKLTDLGVSARGETEASWEPAARDKTAPEKFYSTTNHRTEVFTGGTWKPVENQRMDAVIVRESGVLRCVKLRDLRCGTEVLIGSEAVRVFPPEAILGGVEGFAFMSGEVSSERNTAPAAERIAKELRRLRDRGGKVVAVAGPVVVHTGGADALASMIREGWIQGFLGGNAVAVHDLEYRYFGTSLGVDLETGRPTREGHKNHMMAINRVYGYGSMEAAVRAGDPDRGLVRELVDSGIPYCLAGSIRDDGPLPETVTDMIEAQARYAAILENADMILMLASMLHAIGTGNMTPSWVKTVCVDINPAVVTKLSDRGSGQAVGVVSDVGLFLRTLADALEIGKESRNG